ncbi:protein S100-A1-like [Thunnus albacares]|uniref:protein S100-A1-like n=1 Tax=Thunnus albacares TaxID=8236 RepID=UPI001CF6604A|nr:protein S100-A1-like [Thunnus albacares]XP_044216204.1 protein S100-A1-like [Thunnus albacares]
MATKVEQGMIGLIELFHSYASKGGDPTQLDKKELKTLLKTEFPNFVSACKDPAELDKFMSELDFNGDGQVDFNEFMIMVTTMTLVCNQVVMGASKK